MAARRPAFRAPGPPGLPVVGRGASCDTRPGVNLLSPGALVADRFEVEAVAGHGGMGDVYRARDRHTAETVALKVLRVSDRESATRFSREATLLAGLRHPAIVRYVAHGEAEESAPFLAMEWIDGEDLGARLARGAIGAAAGAALVRRVAEGLAAAHARGIVHRDVKPENVFLPGGDLERAKILDFGIARCAVVTTLVTAPGLAVGTPGFMAPEQVRGQGDIDVRADVFALGCLLYLCVTGRLPFEGHNLMAILAKILFADPPRAGELCEEVSGPLDDLLASMLSKDPSDRPADAAAVAAAITLALAPGASPAWRPRVLPAPSLTVGERRMTSLVVIAPIALSPHDVATVRVMTEGETLRSVEPDQARARMRAEASAFGGRLELLRDGSIVVLFEGGGAATNQAARAASCALALAALSPTARLALATGRAELGGRLPVGAVIDRASQLVASAGPGEIRVDAVTAGLVELRFAIDKAEAGDLSLRARREPRASRLLLGKPTPCVGREREIGSLLATFAACVEDPAARAVLVTAPAGSGKSRLGHELLRRIEEERGGAVSVWTAHGDPVRAGSAFTLAAEMLRRAAGLLDGEPPEVRREKLLARAGRHLAPAVARRVAAFLGEVCGAADPSSDLVELRSRPRRRHPHGRPESGAPGRIWCRPSVRRARC